MSADSKPNYRWLKAAHADLDFWGIAGLLPWPAEHEGKIEPGRPFPFPRLLEGIERLRLAEREWKEEWGKVQRFIERGDELGDALECSDFPKVLRLLDELEVLRPGTAYCSFNRAFVLRTQGEVEEALAAFVEATERAPKLEYVWMRRGTVHEEMDQVKDAIFCYRKALALLPRHMQALEGLARLGAMAKMTVHHPDGRAEEQYFTHKEFERYVAENIPRHRPDDPQLRSLFRQFMENQNGAGALLTVDRILSGHPPDERHWRIQRADALRVLKRLGAARAELKRIFAEDEENVEAFYVDAWCDFDSGQTEEGWQKVSHILRVDPNHRQCIQMRFRIGPKNTDPATTEVLEQWAEHRGSWRGLWLAAVHASTIGDEAGELRCAEKAYKLAPRERDALLFYANALNTMDEGVYTAALVQPRLPEAKGDFQLKYIFAGAMEKLGLKEEAIRVLRESLAEESEMDVEWRRNTEHYLDRLTGLLAEGEIEPERHPNSDVLRRGIWVGGDEGPQVELIPAGVPIPVEKPVRMTPAPGHTGSTGSLACFLHAFQTELEPVSLGWFRVHEIDFAAEEKPMLLVRVHRKGKLEATARQGERRLPVTWSLYRVPSMETEGK